MSDPEGVSNLSNLKCIRNPFECQTWKASQTNWKPNPLELVYQNLAQATEKNACEASQKDEQRLHEGLEEELLLQMAADRELRGDRIRLHYRSWKVWPLRLRFSRCFRTLLTESTRFKSSPSRHPTNRLFIPNFCAFSSSILLHSTSYEAYYCAGKCNFGNSKEVRHSSFMYHLNKSSSICCTGQKYSGISIVYMENKQILYGELKDMVVDRCGCS